MGRPSIFSQNYDDSMKRRKRKKFSTVILIIIIIVGGSLYIHQNLNVNSLRGMVKSIFEKDSFGEEKIAEAEEKGSTINEKKGNPIDDKKNLNTDKEKSENESSTDLKTKEETGTTKVEKPIEQNKKEYIGLGKEAMVTVEYKMNGAKKEIIKVHDNEKLFTDTYDENILIHIVESQNTYLIKPDFSVINITKTFHVSSKKKKYTKEYVMEKYKSNAWCKTPKFVGENTIIYVSSLPYISLKEDKYVWMYNIKEGIHSVLYSIKGKEISVLDRKDQTIKINADGKEYIIDANGKIVN